MNEHSLDIIRQTLQFAYALSLMHLPSSKELGLVEDELNQILKIDPYQELLDLQKKLNELKAQKKEEESKTVPVNIGTINLRLEPREAAITLELTPIEAEIIVRSLHAVAYNKIVMDLIDDIAVDHGYEKYNKLGKRIKSALAGRREQQGQKVTVDTDKVIEHYEQLMSEPKPARRRRKR